MFNIFLKALLINLCFLGAVCSQTERAFYQSENLKKGNLNPMPGEFFIKDDKQEKVAVAALKDENEMLFWYRRVDTEVCLTGECNRIDVGIYWDCTGSFYGLEVYREPLTKTDHSNFFPADYTKLISILSNDWSSLREYEFTDLLDEKPAGVDGISGATKSEIASEAVRDAVYTTYTIWHLIHLGEQEQLSTLTLEFLKSTDLITRLINDKDKKYQHFLLDLSQQGKLPQTRQIQDLILKGLTTSDDAVYRDLAIKSITKPTLDDPRFQNEIGKIYSTAQISEKVELLTSLKTFNLSDKKLYEALEADLNSQNEWLSVKILNVLKNSPTHTDKVTSFAKSLLESTNEFVKNSAALFLNY
ncbi:hypothetical protein [Dyadobacter psychrotolerans]|uniref:Uncharacterized protein n=1 Tax=Dyadobacter psychrotolerans TaxID=2541721 RepID=A0A4R5DUQ7_9BACT|nr:hypothetical protein [Dyadobacter psychrotolerans]TDE18276.1 hypothetical protein E0F88_01680 [Dyadobacter psychrotolerans]